MIAVLTGLPSVEADMASLKILVACIENLVRPMMKLASGDSSE